MKYLITLSFIIFLTVLIFYLLSLYLFGSLLSITKPKIKVNKIHLSKIRSICGELYSAQVITAKQMKIEQLVFMSMPEEAQAGYPLLSKPVLWVFDKNKTFIKLTGYLFHFIWRPILQNRRGVFYKFCIHGLSMLGFTAPIFAREVVL